MNLFLKMILKFYLKNIKIKLKNPNIFLVFKGRKTPLSVKILFFKRPIYNFYFKNNFKYTNFFISFFFKWFLGHLRGYKRCLFLKGDGLKFIVFKNKLFLKLESSRLFFFTLPDQIQVFLKNKNYLELFSFNFFVLNIFSYKLLNSFKPNIYTGKGLYSIKPRKLFKIKK